MASRTSIQVISAISTAPSERGAERTGMRAQAPKAATPAMASVNSRRGDRKNDADGAASLGGRLENKRMA
jgi:hypothetical protein